MPDFDSKLSQSLLFYRLCDRMDDMEKALLDKALDCSKHKEKTELLLTSKNAIDSEAKGAAAVYKSIALYGSALGLFIAGVANITKVIEFIMKLVK